MISEVFYQKIATFTHKIWRGQSSSDVHKWDGDIDDPHYLQQNFETRAFAICYRILFILFYFIRQSGFPNLQVVLANSSN